MLGNKTCYLGLLVSIVLYMSIFIFMVDEAGRIGYPLPVFLSWLSSAVASCSSCCPLEYGYCLLCIVFCGMTVNMHYCNSIVVLK